MIFYGVFLFFLTSHPGAEGCVGFYAPCCAGEYLNATIEKCIACPIGYHGLNCSERCDYPYYGKDCTEGTCLNVCEKELCDIATGCRQITTKEEKPTGLDLLTSETTSELSTRNTTLWGTLISVRKEEKPDRNQSTIFTFENPILLIILGVNFVFFVIISIYVCNKVKNACSPTPSAEEKNIKNLDINLDPYQALQTDTYAEISMDYNMLNEVGVSVEKPSVVKVDSPPTSNTGERSDYDDIANVVEHK